MGINEESQIIFYNKKENPKKLKIYWNIYEINKNQFIIKNKYNNKFIEANNTNLKFSNEISFLEKNIGNNKNISKKFIFDFFKLYEEEMIKKNNFKFINISL